jgi:hypothetical protein
MMMSTVAFPRQIAATKRALLTSVDRAPQDARPAHAPPGLPPAGLPPSDAAAAPAAGQLEGSARAARPRRAIQNRGASPSFSAFSSSALVVIERSSVSEPRGRRREARARPGRSRPPRRKPRRSRERLSRSTAPPPRPSARRSAPRAHRRVAVRRTTRMRDRAREAHQSWCTDDLRDFFSFSRRQTRTAFFRRMVFFLSDDRRARGVAGDDAPETALAKKGDDDE